MSDALPVDLEAQRWSHLDRVLFRNSPLAHELFSPDEDTKDFLQNYCKVLVIGAGGLGCEILKNLIMSGFKHIDVVDMDTISRDDLHSQFLFKQSYLGKSKSQVVADYFNQRGLGVTITPHYEPIQHMDTTFFQDFNIIICGVKNVQAPRWLNEKLANLVEEDTQGQIIESTVIPYIVGTTNGFHGNVQVIMPGQSSCYECMLKREPYRRGIPLDYLVACPRQPEHCIEYVLHVLWDRTSDKKVSFGMYSREISDEKFDNENPLHIKWVFQQAKEYANNRGVRDVTLKLTEDIVKKLTPVYVGTNAVIGSVCANEALKLATLLSKPMNNTMEYHGNEGIVTRTRAREKVSDCPVCGMILCTHMTVQPYMTVKEWKDSLAEDYRFLLKNPTIRYYEKTVYVPNIKSIEQQTRHNLNRFMIDVIPEVIKVRVSDTNAQKDVVFEIVVHYQHYGFLGASLTRNNFSDLLIVCIEQNWT